MNKKEGEIVDDHKDHTCDKCIKERSVKEFVIYGSKYNPNVSMICRVCNGYRRFENESAKEVSLKKNGTGNEMVLKSDHLFFGYLIQKSPL